MKDDCRNCVHKCVCKHINAFEREKYIRGCKAEECDHFTEITGMSEEE